MYNWTAHMPPAGWSIHTDVLLQFGTLKQFSLVTFFKTEPLSKDGCLYDFDVTCSLTCDELSIQHP